MKTDSLFYRLFQNWPHLAIELLHLPYSGESYAFVSEEIKQTGFRIDGLFKPIGNDPTQPLLFAEVQYQPDSDFYGRFLTEIALYLYRQKPNRPWLAFVVYPSRGTEKSASIEFEPFMALPQLQRIYLEDFQNGTALTPGVAMIRLIASQPQQTVELARTLAANRTLLGPEGLDFIETVLVYKLPHLSREEIRVMLALTDIELKQTRFYQEIAREEMEEGLQKGRKEECVALVTRLLKRRLGLHPELDQTLPQLSNRPVEQLEELAEALLDFSEMNDLTTWLQKHLA